MIDVKALRATLGWSQTDLARFLVVADSTIARWESGDRTPTGRSGDDLEALGRVLDGATTEKVQAVKDAASRGETVKTLVASAIENLVSDRRRQRGG